MRNTILLPSPRHSLLAGPALLGISRNNSLVNSAQSTISQLQSAISNEDRRQQLLQDEAQLVAEISDANDYISVLAELASTINSLLGDSRLNQSRFASLRSAAANVVSALNAERSSASNVRLSLNNQLESVRDELRDF